MPNEESSLPYPDFFTPPKGYRGSDFTSALINTAPELISFANCYDLHLLPG